MKSLSFTICAHSCSIYIYCLFHSSPFRSPHTFSITHGKKASPSYQSPHRQDQKVSFQPMIRPLPKVLKCKVILKGALAGNHLSLTPSPSTHSIPPHPIPPSHISALPTVPLRSHPPHSLTHSLTPQICILYALPLISSLSRYVHCFSLFNHHANLTFPRQTERRYSNRRITRVKPGIAYQDSCPRACSLAYLHPTACPA